jgi:ATP synthase alpha/beta family, beta-barrel domain
MPSLADDLAHWAEQAGATAAGIPLTADLRDIGSVESIGDGIATILGLPHVCADEVLRFAGGALGMAVTLEPDHIGAVLLSPWDGVAAGSQVQGSGAVVRTGDRSPGPAAGWRAAATDRRILAHRTAGARCHRPRSGQPAAGDGSDGD